MFESRIQRTAEFHHLRGKQRHGALQETAAAQSQPGQGAVWLEHRNGGSSQAESCGLGSQHRALRGTPKQLFLEEQ